MAIIHPHTSLVPSKLELLASWLPSQPWFAGDAADLAVVASYRFDDPAGEVGLQGLLVTAGDDTVYHVPLSYRGGALEGGEEYLLGTSEHGVLGTRWFSDAAGDPVFRAVLAETIARGGHEAEEFDEGDDGSRSPRELSTLVRGSGRPEAEVPDFASASVATSGTATRAESGTAVLEILRVIDTESISADAMQPGTEMLSARWQGQDHPAVLALLRAA